ncbi:MAG: HAD-IB family hydrolase [Gammaproteobacteria bacterium]|nr:HAD-IB family hydrolase [Gammaproteobacteria bacterium]
MPEVKQLIIFDLDKTLTRRDTLLPYLFGFLIRQPWRVFRTLHLPVAALLFKIGIINNTRLKEIFITAFLAGTSREEIRHWSDTFIDRLLARGMRREAIDRLNQHINAGDYTILLSASLDIYVHDLGNQLGFEEIICTRAEWKSDRLTGLLASANHQGAEKVRQLDKLREQYPDATITAYADNDSDIDLLRRADNGILVNASRKTRQMAYHYEIDNQIWRN